MLTELGQNLLDVWRTLPRRDDEPLPHWQDVRAEMIAPIMKYLWVMEHQPPAAMIIKFLGTEVVRLSGADTTGQNFLKERTNPLRRSVTLAIYQATHDTPCATMLARTLERPGHAPRELMSTMLPLAGASAENWLLIGCTETRDTADMAPEGIGSYTTRRMHPPRFIDLGFGVPDWSPDRIQR